MSICERRVQSTFRSDAAARVAATAEEADVGWRAFRSFYGFQTDYVGSFCGTARGRPGGHREVRQVRHLPSETLGARRRADGLCAYVWIGLGGGNEICR